MVGKPVGHVLKWAVEGATDGVVDGAVHKKVVGSRTAAGEAASEVVGRKGVRLGTSGPAAVESVTPPNCCIA